MAASHERIAAAAQARKLKLSVIRIEEVASERGQPWIFFSAMPVCLRFFKSSQSLTRHFPFPIRDGVFGQRINSLDQFVIVF
jgi:hypothetical protein